MKMRVHEFNAQQPGLYSSWQCVCTATVANANCNACWSCRNFFVLPGAYNRYTSRGLFEKKLYRPYSEPRHLPYIELYPHYFTLKGLKFEVFCIESSDNTPLN